MGYQELCLKYPNLDVFDYQLPNPLPLTEDDQQREAIMFTMLISILERAFIMYRVNSPAVRQRQWDGWVEYIDAFLRRENFRNAWEKYSEMFDTDFRAFVATRIQPKVDGAKVISNSA